MIVYRPSHEHRERALFSTRNLSSNLFLDQLELPPLRKLFKIVHQKHPPATEGAVICPKKETKADEMGKHLEKSIRRLWTDPFQQNHGPDARSLTDINTICFKSVGLFLM